MVRGVGTGGAWLYAVTGRRSILASPIVVPECSGLRVCLPKSSLRDVGTR